MTVLALTACALVAGYGYRAIQDELKRGLASFSIPEASSSFAILQDARCIGRIKTIFVADEQGNHIQAELAIHGVAQSVGRGEFTFNDLGQMTASLGTISLPTGDLRAATLGVNPMEFRIKGTLFSRPVAIQMSIPGPVLMRRSGKVLTIVLPPAQSSVRPHDQPLGITVVSDTMGVCEKLEAPDLDRLLKNLPAVAPLVSQLRSL